MRRAGSVLVILAAALIFVVIALWIFVPYWLIEYQAADLTTDDRLRAMNDVRTALVALIAALGAVGTLLFTARTYNLSREGHVTDRYSKAVGQLGDNSSSVRIGGIYALERIGVDSSKDRTTIIYVLGAFIRERSKLPRERHDEPPEEVKAAIRVVGRLLLTAPNVVFDLRGADLRNANLSQLPTSQLRLDGSDTTGARLPSSS